IEDYSFDLDLHAEVFEACAYHYWGLFESDAKAMATLILGGGVPKNYNLQPEPALGQVLGLPNVRGYEFDVQITTAPVTDGSLSSCPPAEAVTWGKVDKETYQQSTESLPADYSMIMPFLVKALMEKHASREPVRLYERRTVLTEKLHRAVAENREWLMESLRYPLAKA
ncbi:MAG TPA: deoxyhypusine synthase family protein, partial [Bryobacteraceae bacterium]|nr:deoxyhypusine synthase family protein [Bryobacteraceae bacterium]